MALPTLDADDCDDCLPDYMKQAPNMITTAWRFLPFLATFILVFVAALLKLFPILSGEVAVTNAQKLPSASNGHLPYFKEDHVSPRTSVDRSDGKSKWRSTRSILGITQTVFSANIALSAVLVVLLLAEVSRTFDTSTRQTALAIVIPALLFLLVIVAPGLEVHSIIVALGLAPVTNSSKKTCNRTWITEVLAFGIWLFLFWSIGHSALGLFLRNTDLLHQRRTFLEGCLDRVGIIGISLMACLSGFAAISAPWQSFGSRARLVTDADVAKKTIGLETVEDMLATKQGRLRTLSRRMSETAGNQGMFARVVGRFRGTSESQEYAALQLEISGLETMRLSLANTLYTLQLRRSAQARDKTALGRVINGFAYGFAVYCVYRLATTSLSAVRRFLFPLYDFKSGTDPVTNILALLTTHWDDNLDTAAWSRQISFLLSGFMLLASFNSALQTFLLLGRAFPGLLSAFHANLALVVSQVMATYVISSALLLRSNLPQEVGSAISDALGAPLEPRKVDAWFETWFLCAAFVTAVGIWLGRRIKGMDDEEDEGSSLRDMEITKIS